MRLPALQLSCRLFLGGGGAKHHITQVSPPPLLQPRFGSLRLLAFPKAKIAVEREEISECDGHTFHRLSQRRLTAEAPQQSDCSRKPNLLWLAAKLHQSHATGSRDIQSGWILSAHPSYSAAANKPNYCRCYGGMGINYRTRTRTLRKHITSYLYLCVQFL